MKTPLWRILALALALTMFAQTFQYLIDVFPLYVLSKTWPLLTLPLAAWALARLRMPHRVLIIANLAWVLAVAPFMGNLWLGTSLTGGLATTVKAWGFTYPLSCAAAIVLLRPTPRLLRQVLLGLGVALFAGLLLVWLTVPHSVYDAAGADTKFFMYDTERGYHLFLPIFFGLLLIFWLNRSFWIRPALWKAAGIGVCFIILLVVYKERATIAGAALTVVLGAAASFRRRLRPAVFSVLAVGGCVLALLIINHMQSASLQQDLGGSLSIRRHSVATAVDYLSANPLRWIVGVGSVTRIGTLSLGDLLHNGSFYLADIGWLGVVFEYGVIGGTLIAMLHLAALRLAWRTARPHDAMALAVGDCALYVLLVSPIYSVMFTPGEIMTCFALSYCFGREARLMGGGAPPP